MIIQKGDNEVILNIPILISDEDIDDIMSDIMDSPDVQEWVTSIDVVGKYKGEYASEQISRGGKLKVNLTDDMHETVGGDKVHVLSKPILLEGLRCFVREYPVCITQGRVWVSALDSHDMSTLLQYALFGITYS